MAPAYGPVDLSSSAPPKAAASAGMCERDFVCGALAGGPGGGI